jgi:hypothetical protein
MEILALLTCWLIFAFLGSWIAVAKRRDGPEGFLLGILFGPFGCLIEALLPNGSEAKYEAAQEAKRRHIQQKIDAEKELFRAIGEGVRVTSVGLARVSYRTACALLLAIKMFIIRSSPWFQETIVRFGWYKALPEIAQPIVLGLGVALPLVVIIIVLLR